MSRKPKKAVIPPKEIFLNDLPIDRRTRQKLQRMSQRLKKPPELLVARWVRDWLRELDKADMKTRRKMLDSIAKMVKSRR